mmetsp:Transcript_16187/g.33263  ORF Transcript_16187/g.33263 Transcript_16187/m.33263 type:complete len:203 (+) Transcript_16187:569-1177(+)
MGSTESNCLSMFLYAGRSICWYVWNWWWNDYSSFDVGDGCSSSHLHSDIIYNGVLHRYAIVELFCCFQLDSMGLCRSLFLHWIYRLTDRQRNHAKGEANCYGSGKFREKLIYCLLHRLCHHAVCIVHDIAVCDTDRSLPRRYVSLGSRTMRRLQNKLEYILSLKLEHIYIGYSFSLLSISRSSTFGKTLPERDQFIVFVCTC